MNEPILPPIIPIPSKRIKDITGQRFGLYVVLGYIGLFTSKKRAYWLCRCDCGNYRSVVSDNLRAGKSNSCGCVKVANFAKWNASRPRAVRPKVVRKKRPAELPPVRSIPEYGIWQAMRTRCNNPNVNNYHNYGGRGIKVCERWNDFFSFLSDMGPRPSPKHSIERHNYDGDYCPENCYWATREVKTITQEKMYL